MTSFKKNNWNRSTPKKYRNLGDALLVLGSGLNGIILSLPIDSEIKVWIIAITSIISTIGKFLTKLFTEEKRECLGYIKSGTTYQERKLSQT